jgi:hypothetical protein
MMRLEKGLGVAALGNSLGEFLEDMGLVDTRTVARFPTREEGLSKGFFNRYNIDEEGEPIF